MENITRISLLEQQIMNNIFGAASHIQSSSNHSHQLTQQAMLKFAFRDILDTFLKLAELQQSAQREQSSESQLFAGNTSSLISSHLQLNIEIEQFSHVQPTKIESTQPLSVQQIQSDTGIVQRIEVYTPVETQNGEQLYTVSVLKTALSVTSPPSQSEPVVQTKNEGFSSRLSQDLASLWDKSRFTQIQSVGTNLMSYQHDNPIGLIKEEEKFQKWRENQDVMGLIKAATQAANGMGFARLFALMGYSEEDKALLKDAMESDPATLARKLLIIFLQKKRIELEQLREEQQKQKTLSEYEHSTSREQQVWKEFGTSVSALLSELKDDNSGLFDMKSHKLVTVDDIKQDLEISSENLTALLSTMSSNFAMA